MSENELKLKNRILKQSEEMFFNHGFSTITMSQIANELGIGKATIYKYFTNKESILEEIIQLYFEDINTGIDNIHQNNESDFIEKMKQYVFFVAEKLTKISKTQMIDIKRSVPDIWNLIENLREHTVQKHFRKLLEEGIERKFLRNDINKDLIVLIIFNSIQKLSDPEIIVKHPYTYMDVFQAFITIVFEGISEKNIDYKIKMS